MAPPKPMKTLVAVTMPDAVVPWTLTISLVLMFPKPGEVTFGSL